MIPSLPAIYESRVSPTEASSVDLGSVILARPQLRPHDRGDEIDPQAPELQRDGHRRERAGGIHRDSAHRPSLPSQTGSPAYSPRQVKSKFLAFIMI